MHGSLKGQVTDLLVPVCLDNIMQQTNLAVSQLGVRVIVARRGIVTSPFVINVRGHTLLDPVQEDREVEEYLQGCIAVAQSALIIGRSREATVSLGGVPERSPAGIDAGLYLLGSVMSCSGIGELTGGNILMENLGES